MLPEHKLNILQELVSQASREELIWMNGFLAGLVQAAPATAEQEAGLPAAVKKITIAYGTETGNAKKLATQFATTAKKQGVVVKLSGLDQYRLTDLPREEYLFTIISTQGDGEPPATAKKFFEHIYGQQPVLGKLKYGVLGLGDTAYPLFCKAAEDVDAQLLKLGASRVVTLQKCDTDFEADAAQWFNQVLQTIRSAPVPVAPAVLLGSKTPHKKNYTGTILSNTNLNDRGSQKQTHHIEIAVEDGLEYQPGDAFGLVPPNRRSSVDQLLQLAGIAPGKELFYKDGLYTAAELLQQKLNIYHLPERVVARYAALVQQEIPDTRIDLVNLLKIYPVKDAQQFEEVVSLLEPIAPRLYSIASSPLAHEGEVHLTVSRCRFEVNSEWKYGHCSDYLCQLEPGAPVAFYIHRNNLFRLPAAHRDVIMIGPGTGIAPFRSFLAERDAAGATGRHWLFFGEQHFVSDFLYQTEIQGYAQTGVLQRVSLAFSRDQQQKIYVQHRMQQQAAELWQWIDHGAYVYVCGAKDPMSKDVEQTLLSIFEQQGGQTAEAAAQYLEQLQAAGRYLKDVY